MTSSGACDRWHLRVYDAGMANPPNTSNLQFNVGETRAELVVTKVSANGRIRMHNGSTGVADVFADVQGWYTTTPDGTPNVYSPITPTRVLNTPTSTGTCTPNCSRMSAGATKTVTLPTTGAAEVPFGASAVVLNVTAVGAIRRRLAASGGSGDPQPVTSNINYFPPGTRPTLLS